MVDPSKHSEKRNFVETILRYIPGFRGYLEKGYRRESDQLVRDHMARRVHETKRALDDFSRELVAQDQLDDLPRLERVRTHLDQLMSMMRGDVRGYSGFFDFVRVDEEVLEHVYEADLALMDEVESLLDSVRQLRDKPDTARSVAADLQRRIESVKERFVKRREILEGLAS